MPQVFDEEKLAALPGEVAIGHTRYSTTGGARWANAQPLVFHGAARTVALGHNGNLVDPGPLRDELLAAGVRLASTSDTEVIARAARPRPGAAARGRRGDDAPARGRVLGRRDRRRRARRVPRPARHPPAHARPDRRRLGRRLRDLRARPRRRRRRPGRRARRGRLGRRGRLPHARRRCPRGRGAACIFEHVYFARPDSMLDGTGVHAGARPDGRAARRGGAGRGRPRDADPRLRARPRRSASRSAPGSRSRRG